MSDMIEILIDSAKLVAALRRLIASGRDLTPAMRRAAGIMHDAVEENFEQEGRPKWKSLAASTIKQRSKDGSWPGKVLQRRGNLARSITRVGRSMKRRCVALVTDMNQPLGDCVGTALEVKEAIELLKGRGPEDLKELVLKLGMEIVRLAGVAGSTLSAKQSVQRHLENGEALAKFREMIQAQGGDPAIIDHPEKLPTAKYVRKLPAPKRGYVHTINAGAIVSGVQILAQDDKGNWDHACGVSEIKKVGTQVKQGEPLMMIHYNDESRMEAALELLRNAYRLAPKRPTPPNLVVERVA